MEEYRPQNFESENEDRKKTFFQDSQLNQLMPLWMKIVFFFLGWLGFQVLSMFLQLAFRPLYVAGIIDAGMYNAILMLTVYGILALFFALFFICNKKIGKAFLNDFKDYKAILFGFAVCVAVLVVENLISYTYQVCFPKIYGSNNNQQGLQSDVASSPIMLFFPIVLFAPFTEELTYRIGLVDSFGKKNRWIGIAVSAIIFGFIHFSFDSILLYANYDALLSQHSSSLIKEVSSITGEYVYYTFEEVRNMMVNEFLNLPIYIIAGFLMALGYAITGNISTSMSAHFMNNLISFISMVALLNGGNQGQIVQVFHCALW